MWNLRDFVGEFSYLGLLVVGEVRNRNMRKLITNCNH